MHIDLVIVIVVRLFENFAGNLVRSGFIVDMVRKAIPSCVIYAVVCFVSLQLVSPQSDSTTVSSDNTTLVEFSPIPITCPGFRQELFKIPVLQESEGLFSYVYGCDEIRSGNCKFPGGTVSLKRPCSLQCSCMRTTDGHYQIGNCYNTCRMPPVGQRCYINGTAADGCCPNYVDCIPNTKTPYGSILLEQTVPFPPFKSQRFRCLPGDILSLEACILFLKREAYPKLQFAYGMQATCRCIAEDIFGFTTHTPTIPNIPVQRYLLVQRGDQILKQPINAVPYTSDSDKGSLARPGRLGYVVRNQAPSLPGVNYGGPNVY